MKRGVGLRTVVYDDLAMCSGKAGRRCTLVDPHRRPLMSHLYFACLSDDRPHDIRLILSLNHSVDRSVELLVSLEERQGDDEEIFEGDTPSLLDELSGGGSGSSRGNQVAAVSILVGRGWDQREIARCDFEGRTALYPPSCGGLLPAFASFFDLRYIFPSAVSPVVHSCP